jgi:hypothetical protein
VENTNQNKADGRLLDVGQVIQSGEQSFEVDAVSYQEVDGQRVNFVYTMRSQADARAEREAIAAAEAKAEAARAESERLNNEIQGE